MDHTLRNDVFQDVSVKHPSTGIPAPYWEVKLVGSAPWFLPPPPSPPRSPPLAPPASASRARRPAGDQHPGALAATASRRVTSSIDGENADSQAPARAALDRQSLFAGNLAGSPSPVAVEPSPWRDGPAQTSSGGTTTEPARHELRPQGLLLQRLDHGHVSP